MVGGLNLPSRLLRDFGPEEDGLALRHALGPRLNLEKRGQT